MLTLRMAVFTLISMSSAGLALAQTPPAQDSTSPSAASSPSQRQATKTESQEAPATNGTDPSAASTPHQNQATHGADKAKHEQMMKDCMAKERAKDSSMSKDDAKKNCMDQMKMSSDKTRPNQNQ
jgi:hypothetical protein